MFFCLFLFMCLFCLFLENNGNGFLNTYYQEEKKKSGGKIFVLFYELED